MSTPPLTDPYPSPTEKGAWWRARVARRGRSLPEWQPALVAGALGAVAFAYQLPVRIVDPANIRWMMKADRGAALSGWLFERNEPWTLPFGILHTMMPPLVMTVGYSDALPWIAVPAKVVSAWTTTPWQYSGLFLLACYVLQAVFGYLVLRALGACRSLSLVGAAFFATSPALL